MWSCWKWCDAIIIFLNFNILNNTNTKMKKLSVLAVSAIVAATSLTSCGTSTPKASLKSDVDSVSYVIGMLQTQGLKEYLSQAKGVDTTYIADFVKGLNEGVNSGEDKRKAAYYAGIEIGQQIANNAVKGLNYNLFGEDSTQSVSLKNFVAGFVSQLVGDKTAVPFESADSVATAIAAAIKERTNMKLYADNKAAGEKFMAEMEKKEGVQKLDGGVLYKVIKAGTGAVPTDSAVVSFHYEGTLIDGTKFDSSYDRNQPLEGPVYRNIKGFATALKNMPAGSIWEVYIPQDQAYGANPSGGRIKPYSALKFKLELLEVKGK